jgi:hypothetical protein
MSCLLNTREMLYDFICISSWRERYRKTWLEHVGPIRNFINVEEGEGYWLYCSVYQQEYSTIFLRAHEWK